MIHDGMTEVKHRGYGNLHWKIITIFSKVEYTGNLTRAF